MKHLKFIVVVALVFLGVLVIVNASYAQGSPEQTLARRFAQAVVSLQKFCIERGKTECELIQIENDPPFLGEGQVVDYIGVRQRGVLYFYLVMAEKDDMDPDIYLFDSQGNSIGASGKGTGPYEVGLHMPEYTQKVLERIKMYKGNGRIGVAILAPVGAY